MVCVRALAAAIKPFASVKFGPKGISAGWINLNGLVSLSRRWGGDEEGREGGGGGCGDGQVKVLGN